LDVEVALKLCDLGKNMFVHENLNIIERFKESSLKKLRESVGEHERNFLRAIIRDNRELENLSNDFYRMDDAQRKRCESVAKRIRATNFRYNVPRETTFSTSIEQSSIHVARPTAVYITSISGLGIWFEGDKLVMRGAKLVEKGNRFDLLSWMHKDLVHYGIKDSQTDQILETFSPTKELKGWELRKHVIELLHKYDKEGVPNEIVTKTSFTKSVEDLVPGNVLAWYNPIKQENTYAIISKITEHLVLSKSKNSEPCFIKDSLQKKIDSGEIWTIRSIEAVQS